MVRFCIRSTKIYKRSERSYSPRLLPIPIQLRTCVQNLSAAVPAPSASPTHNERPKLLGVLHLLGHGVGVLEQAVDQLER